jgi:hypothetical protein
LNFIKNQLLRPFSFVNFGRIYNLHQL